MALDTREFANRVGNEMLRILWTRSNQELENETNSGRIGALLAAALVPVSECLRVSIEAAKNPQAMRAQMVGITTRMLEALLDDVLKPPAV